MGTPTALLLEINDESTRLYQRALEFVKANQFERALAQFESLAAKSFELRFLERLISTRISIKAGNRNLDPLVVPQSMSRDFFLSGEVAFVNALMHNLNERYGEASEAFHQASRFFSQAPGCEQKSALSRFNSLVSRSNQNERDLESDRERDSASLEFLASLRELERDSLAQNIPSVRALVLRQKSYLFQQMKSWRAALNEAERALELLELHSPASDYHLGLIQAADCALELGLADKAATYLDYIVGHVESRVELPLSYIRTRLLNEPARAIDRHPTRNPFWTQKMPQKPSSLARVYEWDLATHEIRLKGSTQILTFVKSKSLEGLLLQMLLKGPQTKSVLCRALWPELAQSEELSNRFFRLLNRVRGKLKGLISSDGQCYQLEARLELAPSL